jgi:hypothetical protein
MMTAAKSPPNLAPVDIIDMHSSNWKRSNWKRRIAARLRGLSVLAQAMPPPLPQRDDSPKKAE